MIDRPANPPQPRNPQADLRDPLDQLLARLPVDQRDALFDIAVPKPLAIGIRETLAAELGLGSSSRKRLLRLLRGWTSRARYIKALAREGARRHGLSGEVGPVSPSHRASAIERLAQMDQAEAAARARPEIEPASKKSNGGANKSRPKLGCLSLRTTK